MALLVAAGCRASDSGDRTQVQSEPVDHNCATLQRSIPGCAVVSVDGRTFRYALTTRGGSRDTVLVDVGGPGAAVIGADYPRELVGALAPRNVLVAYEPWTTAPDLPGCDDAMSAWFLALRRSWPTPDQRSVDARLTQVLHDCRLLTDEPVWGFSREQYAEVVEAIARDHHLRLVGFVGFSFASVRLSYLGELIPESVLTSPFPLGMRAARYLEMRQDVRGPRVREGLVGARVANRANPLTRLDIDAARLESLYLEPRARHQVVSGPDAAQMIGRLSDQLFGRYGVASISHALLAYWEETCPALSGWGAVDTTRYGLPGQLLRICQLAFQRGWVLQPIPQVQPPACVANVRRDGIVTPPMSRWLSHRYGWKVDEMIGGGHANSRGLTKCLVTGR